MDTSHEHTNAGDCSDCEDKNKCNLYYFELQFCSLTCFNNKAYKNCPICEYRRELVYFCKDSTIARANNVIGEPTNICNICIDKLRELLIINS